MIIQLRTNFTASAAECHRVAFGSSRCPLDSLGFYHSQSRAVCSHAVPGKTGAMPIFAADVSSLIQDLPKRLPSQLKVPPEAIRPIDSVHNVQTSSSDLTGWPYLIFGAVAIAIIAEVVSRVKALRQDNSSGLARDQSPEAAYKRQVVYVDQFDERNRGLLYLAAVTVAIVGIAGWFSPNVSQPFLF